MEKNFIFKFLGLVFSGLFLLFYSIGVLLSKIAIQYQSDELYTIFIFAASIFGIMGAGMMVCLFLWVCFGFLFFWEIKER